MEAFRLIAERKISQAIKDGSLETVSKKWRGRPLVHEDDSFVPADLKMAYKMLQNSGFVPPEVQERQEVARLEDLIAKSEDSHERLRQLKKLEVLLMKMNLQGSGRLENIQAQEEYLQRVVERVRVKG
ncbi:MAG: DnaJ family domain-containing protein [Thermodesulfobacteriota bacterium]